MLKEMLEVPQGAQVRSHPEPVSQVRSHPELVSQSIICVWTSDRHISIQRKLEGLELLVDLGGGESQLEHECLIACRLSVCFHSSAGRKSCPLCPEDKFKACYSHKLRRHLQNLHWKVYVEFEGTLTGSAWQRVVMVTSCRVLRSPGHKMCICHLPCRNLRPGLSGDQVRAPHDHDLIIVYNCPSTLICP